MEAYKKIIPITLTFLWMSFAHASIFDVKSEPNLNDRTLSVEFRTSNTQIDRIANVKIGDKEIPENDYKFEQFQEYGKCAYLFLFDKSETAGIFNHSRKDTLNGFSNAINVLMAKQRDRQSFSVYSYSDRLYKNARFPLNAHAVLTALNTLQIDAQTTNPVLYMPLCEAMRDLAIQNTDRKVLFIMGTGKSSDTRWTSDRAVKFAKNNNIIICAAGKAELPEEKSSIQRYAELVEKTNGKMYDITNQDMRNTRFLDLFDAIETGGRIVVKIPNDINVDQKVTITLDSGDTIVIDDINMFKNPDMVNIEELKKVYSLLNWVDDLKTKLLKHQEETKKALDDIDNISKSIKDTTPSGVLKKSLDDIAKNASNIADENAKLKDILLTIDKSIEKAEKTENEQSVKESTEQDKAQLANLNKKISIAKEYRKEVNDLQKNIQKSESDITIKIESLINALTIKPELIDSEVALLEKDIKTIKDNIENLSRKTDSAKKESNIEEISRLNDLITNEAHGLQGKIDKIKSQYSLSLNRAKELVSKLDVLLNANIIPSNIKKISSEKKKKIEDSSKKLEGISKEINELTLKIESSENALASLVEDIKEKKQDISNTVIASVIVIILIILIAAIIVNKKRNARLAYEKQIREMQRVEIERIRAKEEEINKQKDKENQRIYATITTIDGDPQKFDIIVPICRLGRNKNNDITFSNTSVSGYHAELNFKNNKCHIVDLNSTNGTYLNSKRIQSAEVHSNDIIELGEEVKLKVQLR